MKYPRLIVSLTLAGALASGAALAQQASPQAAPPPPQEKLPTALPDAGAPQADSAAPAFSDLDKKGKGYIQRSDIPKDNEALKQLRAHFNEADQDHNGRVDASEYNAYVNKGSAPKSQ
jgi:hypothetical protein